MHTLPCGRLARRAARVLGVGTILTSLLAGAGCAHGHDGGVAPLPAGGLHVLFVGNSLTYVNGLPATVEAIAASAGDTVRTRMVAAPNLAVIDHLYGATDAVAVVDGERWDFVVLQQGPTTQALCRDTLVLAAQGFDPHVRRAGGRTALYMTWPASDAASPDRAFDAVRESFQSAATAVDGVFLPAGEAWRAAWAEDPTLALYGGDGFHPSPTGSFLAALEIYERLTGRDARTLPASAFIDGNSMLLPEAEIRLLQRAAHAANERWSPIPARASRASRAAGASRALVRPPRPSSPAITC